MVHGSRKIREGACFLATEIPPYRTRTRTNTNPNDTKANDLGRRGVRVRSANGMCENQGEWAANCLKKERHLWVKFTLEIHTGRRLTCGTQSSITAEVKNGSSAHRAPSALPPGKCPSRARTLSSAFRVTVKRGVGKNRHHASGPLVA